MHDIDPKLILQALQFLYTIYQSRWGKKPSENKTPETGAAPEPRGPDPERMEGLIKEVEDHPRQTGDKLAAEIDKKFPPEQAHQVKSDLRTLAAIVSPPDFREYDYFGMVQDYAKGLQSIALKTELFRLRGVKIDDETRLLLMPTSAEPLLPPRVREDTVYPPYQSTAAVAIRKVQLGLVDRGEAPLKLAVEADFIDQSYGTTTDTHSQAYMITPGQDRNWLGFEPVKNIPGFRGCEWRLNATDVRAVLTAMKKDITAYLIEIEKERPVVKEILVELQALRAIQAAEDSRNSS
jgi:hypothetical protein